MNAPESLSSIEAETDLLMQVLLEYWSLFNRIILSCN